jgi:hypothetical protein
VAEAIGREQFVSVVTLQLLAMPAPAAMAEFVQLREVLRTQIMQEAFRLDRKKYKKLKQVSDELSAAEIADYSKLMDAGHAAARGVEIKYNRVFDGWYASLQHGWSDGWGS